MVEFVGGAGDLPTIANRTILGMEVAMPTRNINLTPQMDKFVESKIKKGEYANASEVLRAGLRALEQSEEENRAKLKAIRAAVLAGEESGTAEGDEIGEIRERIRRRALGMERV
jgi:antitoxin ParD1/3/4